MTKQLLYILILFLSIACNKSDIQEIEKLNIAYAKSFVCPFGNVKILVQNDAGVCGNTSDDEMASLYFPTLYKKPILPIIQPITKIDSIVHNINFENDSTKTYVEIIGHTENKVDTVFITENFSLNNKSITIEKIATYKNDNWHIKTLRDENLY